MKRLGWLVLSLALAGCGSQVCDDCAALAPTPSVSARNGSFLAVASPARVHAGDMVHLTLTVTGPMKYEAGCVQTLHIWAEDNQLRQVWNQPEVELQCLALSYKTLKADETATFAADWPTSSTLAPGTYTLHGLFLTVLPPGAGMRVRENIPALPIRIVG